jgi:uncharacterized protein YdeI (YjbR/CyaY-like superfamily)
MPPAKKPDLPILEISDQAGWEEWLEQSHDSSSGVWLKIAKKGSPVATVSRPDALDSAICFGWIDGQGAAHDESFWLQRFTPRTPRSKWSQINRDKAAYLIAAGRMRPAGLRAVEAAKSDGRWDAAYPAQSAATVPDDLQQALEQNPKAKAFFETLSAVNRYAFLYRLHGVKRPENRVKRIENYIEMLSEGKTFHP